MRPAALFTLAGLSAAWNFAAYGGDRPRYKGDYVSAKDRKRAKVRRRMAKASRVRNGGRA